MAKDGNDDEARRFYSSRLRWMQAVLASEDLTDKQARVAIAIALRINPPYFVSFPDLHTIAQDAAMSRRTAMRCIEGLEAKAWLFVHRQKRRVNRYSIMMANV